MRQRSSEQFGFRGQASRIEEDDDIETWIAALRGDDDVWCVDWHCDDHGTWWRGFKSYYRDWDDYAWWREWMTEAAEKSPRCHDRSPEEGNDREFVARSDEEQVLVVEASQTLA